MFVHLQRSTFNPQLSRAFGSHQTRQQPYFSPFLRDPRAATWSRHTHNSGVAWPQRCLDDDDLHARVADGRERDEKSFGLPLTLCETPFSWLCLGPKLA